MKKEFIEAETIVFKFDDIVITNISTVDLPSVPLNGKNNDSGWSNWELT